MTSSPDSQPSEAGFFTAIRSWGITRGDNGFLGGVVDGLAQRVGMATGPARIIVVAAAIFLNGIVLLAYAAGWALLPDRRGNIIIQNFGRGVPNVGALIGIGVIALFGFGGIDNGLTYQIGSFPFDGGGPLRVIAIVFAVMVPLAILAGVIGLIVVLAKRGGQPSAPGSASAAYAAMPGQAPHQHPASTAPSMPATGQDVADATRTDGADTGVADAVDADAVGTDAVGTDAVGTGRADADAVDTERSAAAPEAATATSTSASAMPSTYAYAPVPPVPPAPPRRPRVPGPGKGFYLATLAWLFLSAAGVAFAARNDELAVHGAVAWFVTFIAGLGVLLVLISLSGRKLGFLGFVGVMSVLPVLGIIASADDIRESFARDESLITIDFGLEPEEAAEPEYDATTAFAGEYPHVVINGSCYQDTLVPAYPTSSARISALNMTEDRSIDVTAEVTHVTVPAGTSITVRGEGDAQAHVVWPDRDITCDFYNAGGEHLRLAGPSPTLELVVYDDEFANTIVLTEVAP